jgi:hypothetical protein
VDRAKKHIDPAHPRSGPYGIDAATDPTNPKAFLQSASTLSAIQAATAVPSNGQIVDIQA